MIKQLINKIKKIKSMINNDSVSPEETNNDAPTSPVEQTETTKEESVNLSPELTLDILNSAIAKFESENPDKKWDDITQEERWDYIKQTRESQKS